VLAEGIYRVEGLMSFQDPESYIGGSVATDRVSLAGQVKAKGLKEAVGLSEIGDLDGVLALRHL